MKRIISNVMLVAAAAMAFFACQKQEINAPEEVKVEGLNFSAEKPEFADASKTEWTGSEIQWSKGDKIRVAYTCDGVWQNADGTSKSSEVSGSKTAKIYESKAITEAGSTAFFSVPGYFKGTAEGVYEFYGIYPSSLVSGADIKYAPSVTITIPTTQTPTASSFDSEADVMASKSQSYVGIPKEGENNGPISLKWERLVAHGYFTLKNLAVEGEEDIQTITLTANADADMVGEHYLYLDTHDVEKAAGNNAANSLTVKANNLTIAEGKEGGDVTFWACFLPCTWKSLDVVVETDKATYTRSINLTGKEKTFKQNARNTLGINMATAEREVKLVPDVDYSGTYVIVAHRNTSSDNNFYYMTGVDCGASTKRFAAELAGETCPSDVDGLADTHKWEIEKSGESYVVTCVDSGQSISWTSGNSAFLADTGLPFVIAENEDGTYTFKYAASDGDRYISLNNTTGNDYFALYKSGQVMNLYLLRVAPDTTPKIIVENTSYSVKATDTSVEIPYNVKNITGTISATVADDATISNINTNVTDVTDVTDGKVTISFDANTESTEKTATIVLSYEGAESVNVTVTQEGTSAEGGEAELVWTLVTDASTLAVGDQIIIAAKDYDYAVGPASSNGNNRTPAAITKSGNILTSSDGVTILTLQAGTVDGTYALYTGTKYLYAASSSSNYLREKADKDANGSWKISISSDGTASIVAQGTYSRNTMQYNQSSSLFACYSSASQKAVVIYKQMLCSGEGGETPEEPETPVQPTKLSTPVVKCSDSDITENSLKFTWDAVANASKYVVTFNNGTSTETPDTYYVATGLNANTKYSISVKAVGDGVNYTESDAGTAEGTTKEAQQPDDTQKYYVKVTSSQSDWSGTYLIVYESGATAYVYNGTDSGAKNYVSATISDNQIARSSAVDAVAVQIAKSGSGYSIKVPNGKYISGGTSNGTTFNTSAVANTITLNTNGTVKINNNTTTSFQFNSASDQMRFRYFKSAQKSVYLYKLN